jgi:hypothetical protein
MAPFLFMLEISRIMSEAAVARHELASNTVDRKLLADLCLPYASSFGGNVDHFLDRTLPNFPDGNCGVASIYLKHRLEGGELRNGTFHGLTHVVLDLSEVVLQYDDLISDITADQFGGPKIYVGPMRDPWSLA